MKNAAIITASGFGDGLLMLVAASSLEKAGYNVTVFNNNLISFAKWLPSLHFEKYPFSEKRYLGFDLCLLQNDNSKRAKDIIEIRDKLNLFIFYPSHSPKKHAALLEKDWVFDKNLTMVENIAEGSEKLFHNKSFEPNIKIPSFLQHRKYLKRVVIHAASGDPDRNWPLSKYDKLAAKLEGAGFAPLFISSPKEKDYFAKLSHESVSFNDLSDLAALIYESGFFIGNESGPSHLASLLKIPGLVISNNKKRMQLWQPGWQKALIITPFSFVPNLKNFRIREKYWKAFIPVFKVFNSFIDKVVSQ